MNMTIDITEIIIWIIGVLIGLVTTYLIPWIKTKLKNEKIKVVVQIADQVVKAAHELNITGELAEMGLTKVEYAWNEATKALAAKGITIDEEELKAYIKAAVTELRKDVIW